MKKFLLSFVFLLISILSFAIAPITGSTSTCVGWTASLSDATPGGTWSSSNPAIATVSSAGMVSGIATGAATITYTVGSSYVTTPFTVNPADVITGGTSVCIGSTLPLSGFPAGGSWTSGTPTVASVSSAGLVTGVSAGTVNIYYTAGGCYTYQIVTVSGSLAGITGITSTTVGSSSTLANTTPGGTWSSSNTAIATVGSASGIVTGVGSGTCNITYTAGGCSVYTSFSVTSPILPVTGPGNVCTGYTITLSSSTMGGNWSSSNTARATVGSVSGIVSGVSAGAVTITYTVGSSYVTKPVTVNATPAAITGATSCVTGSTTTLADITPGGVWSTSNPAVATITSGGMVSGISAGSCTITYTLGSCAVYFSFTVTHPSISPITGYSSGCVGSPISLSCATPGGTWSSSNPAIASISSGGVVTGMMLGSVTITYTVGSSYVTFPFTVNPLPVISGGSTMCTGTSMTLSATPSGGSWTSGGPLVASVSSTGVVTALTPGIVNIYYTNGCATFKTITVSATPAPVTGSSSCTAGSSTPLACATPGGIWSSSNPLIATISSGGMVSGIAAGSCTITYTLGSCSVYYFFTVNPLYIAPITGYSSGCVGTPIALADATPGGTWSSSSPAIGTISPAGVVTGIMAGAITISYTIGTTYVTYPFTVNALPVITGGSSVCVGSTLLLTATPTGGSWTSGGPMVATVGSTGLVTALTTGVVNIYYTNGCATYQSVTVTTAPTITGTPNMCTGSSYTFTSSISGGTWSSDATWLASVHPTSGVVTATGVGVVHFTYTLSGCYNTYTVTVYPTPSPVMGISSCTVGGSSLLSCATPGGTWSCSDTTVATVGTSGMVSGIAAGICSITYTTGYCYSYRTFTVNGISPITGGSSVCIGSTLPLFCATPGGAWSSSNITRATIGSSSGIVTGLSTGSLTVTYTVGSSYVTSSFTVNPTTIITGGTPTLCVGSTMMLSAASGGTWSASNANAIVSGGLVTGMSAGAVNITYTNIYGCYYYVTITINPAPSPISGPGSVCVGSSITLTNTLGGGVWSASNSRATAGSASGIVTGVSAGTVIITYTSGTCGFVTRTVTVNPNPVNPYPGTSASICAGSTYAPGSSMFYSYYSSNTAVATVHSTSGLITGLSAGTAGIVYAYPATGCYSTFPVTVNTMPAPITGPHSVSIFGTITLHDATTGGVWTTSNPSIASIHPSTGVVTPHIFGSVTITYTIGTCSVTYSVSVTFSLPVTTISGSVSTPRGNTTSGDMGIHMVLTDNDTRTVVATTVTDESGAYTFDLPAGSYTIATDEDGIESIPATATVSEKLPAMVNFTRSGSRIEPSTVTTTSADVSVHPNPSRGIINIAWENQVAGPADVIVTDVTGRIVFRTSTTFTGSNGQAQVNLGDLKAGIYFITVKAEHVNYSSKLLITN